MIRVNLLPHREERRKRARNYFFVLAAGTALLGAVIAGAAWFVNGNRVDAQVQRNDFLKKEISGLEKEIEEIKKLQDEIAALLARKQVIEALQTDRAQTVYLLEELVRQVPEGVYLRTVTQKGARISLAGYAQSNARVSVLMRNIESSQWLEQPQLVEIKSGTAEKRKVSEFNMNLSLKRPKADAGKDGAKGDAKPAAKAAAAAKKG